MNGVPPGRSKLLAMITEHAYAPDKGTYLPVSDRVKLKGKLPDFSQDVGGPVTPFPCRYFTNALAIPEGYAPDFDVELAPRPIERATNVGLIFVTIEFDPKTVGEVEETLASTRRSEGKDSGLSLVDSELRQFKDYRGYCVVFSGSKSLHFHLVFDMHHLEKVPSRRSPADRLASMQADAGLLANAHRQYWDQTVDVFSESLHPSLEADASLRGKRIGDALPGLFARSRIMRQSAVPM